VTVKGKVKFFNETKGFPAANAVLGTTYGNPGGGNFTMPDLRGRFFFNLDAGGSGRITAAGGNFDGTVLGGTGGQQNRTIAQTNLPSVNFGVSGITLNDPTHTHSPPSGLASPSFVYVVPAGPIGTTGPNNATVEATTGPASTGISISSQGSAASGGSGTALATLPPAMGVNCMMRIG
jgi:microcystin-dependent protein